MKTGIKDDFDANNQLIADKIKSELLMQMGALKQVGMDDTPAYAELQAKYDQYDNGATLYQVIGEEFGDLFENLLKKLDDEIDEAQAKDSETFK